MSTPRFTPGSRVEFFRDVDGVVTRFTGTVRSTDSSGAVEVEGDDGTLSVVAEFRLHPECRGG